MCMWEGVLSFLQVTARKICSLIDIFLRHRSPLTRQVDASLGSCHSQEAVAGNQVLSNCFISHLRISVIFPLAILWWEIRDVEANGYPPSSWRASAKLHTLEQKSDQGLKHWQEINNIPHLKWLPFSYTVGLRLHSVNAGQILFYICFII